MLIGRISEELVLSGTYQCTYNFVGVELLQRLTAIAWILIAVWEVFALCLAVWIAVTHFRELRRSSTRLTVGDCFTVLLKTHILYFAA